MNRKNVSLSIFLETKQALNNQHSPAEQNKVRIVPGFEEIQHWVTSALKEDIASGDITTESIVEPDRKAKGLVTAKEPLTVCGLQLFEAVFKELDEDCSFNNFGNHDGDRLAPGSKVVEVEGLARAVLIGERTALNMMQRLSGIATQTRQYAEAAHPVTLLDTRKTTPGLRIFEKYAVACGGGTNHRFGLFDAVLIKDNHIRIAGGIEQAIDRVRQNLGAEQSIEVETTNTSEIEKALSAGADTILLDNMDDEAVKSAIKQINGKAKIEVSGNITLERLKRLSGLCIDYISVGALTHSVRAVDLSLNIDLS